MNPAALKVKNNVFQPPMVTWTSPKDVVSIIKKYKEGSSKEYDIFINNLTNPQLQDASLLIALKGLRDSVMSLGRDMEVLVGVLLKLNWYSRDASVMRELQTFVLNLVSAHTFYLKACLRMILRQFAPRLESSPSEEIVTIDASVKQKYEELFVNLHNLLRAILQLVPMCPSVLLPMLSECFPYITRDPFVLECYVKNLLIMTQYMPSERIHVLEIVVDKMLKLDVRASRQDIIAVEGDGNESNDDRMAEDSLQEQSMFDMDDDKLLGTDNNQLRPSVVDTMSHSEGLRLDILMTLFLQYVHDICYNDGSLNWEATKQLYRDLVTVFDRLILPTHDSCHVQFIWFYVCSFKQPLVDDFLDHLWKKVQDPNVDVIFRQASVAYLSSLLARANYIPISTVVSMLDLLSSWAKRYITQSEDTGSDADIQRHGSFYSVCQALFYVFAFRHKQLLSLPKGLRYCQGLGLQSLVTCHLNPLQVCSTVVGKTFSSIARSHQIAFCDTVLERNKRQKCFYLSRVKSSDGLRCMNQLESFFPFDPYLLKRSSRVILPLYQEFEGTPVEEDKDSDDDKDMESDLMEEVGSLETTGRLLSSPEDFLLYGTSPGFKTFPIPR